MPGVLWKPMKRVTTAVGYAGSFVRGNTIFLNPLTPSGTLNFNYQQPYASITIDLYEVSHLNRPGTIMATTRRESRIRSVLREFRCRILTAAMRHFHSVMHFENFAETEVRVIPFSIISRRMR